MLRILLNIRILPWLAAVFVLLSAVPAFADTTGAIAGTVSDADGLPIPGATVVLSSPSGTIGGDQKSVTGDDGDYSFRSLLPGTYSITGSADGFQAVTISGVQVLIGRTETVSVVLQAGGSAEVIEIESKRKTVDVEDVTRGEVLTKEFLQSIPTGRTYQSAVSMAAGVTGGAGGNPNMGGGAYNENTYMLDGVNITDPVTGTFSLNFNYDAIQQIEVLLGGYEPEYGISLGGVVNVVTDSGTNNLEFDTAVYYENGNWGAKRDARYGADGLQIAPTGFDSNSQTFSVSAKIAGPVIRDRAWFIFSYQMARSLINNIGVAQPRDFEGHYILGKLTVQPNADHRFTVFMQLDPTSIDNTEQDPNSRILPQAQARQAQGGYVGSARWQWFLSPDVNLDTQFVTQKSYIEVGAVPCTHDTKLGYHPCEPDEQEGNIDWETPGRVGINGAFDSVNYGYYYFDDRYRYTASSKLSVLGITDPFGGSHDFKFGAEATQNVWDQLQGYSGNTWYFDLNATLYDPQTFVNYYWLEITGPIKFRTSSSQWNLFAQDSYKPIRNLTIKYGLRYDNTVMRNDIGETVINASLVSPRLYAAWDPFGDQKTKIAGGYGRFNDTGRLGVASFTRASGYGSKLFLGEYFAASEQGFVNTSALMYDIAPRENTNVAHDKLRTPRVDEFLVLLQREIIEDVSVGGNFSYKMTRFLYEPDEVNVIYDEDGSAIIGSRYGDVLNPVARLRTPQIAKRDYMQADVYVDKVMSHRWFARLTYSYVNSVGSSEGALSGSFLNDPQTQYNYGPMFSTDVNHQVKAYASWELPTDPWSQTVGARVEYYSGQPYDRGYWSDVSTGSYDLRIRPRGEYGRIPGTWITAIKFQQQFDVRKGKVIADVEVTNPFNFAGPASYLIYPSENRLVIYERQAPFQLQLGLRYQF